MHEAVRGVCPQHPGRFASITCKYCGSYACSDCTVDTLWGDTLCVACEARGVAAYPIPWDRSISPGTFVATCRVVFSDLRLIFPSFPDGSVVRALGFAFLINALTVGASALVITLQAKQGGALLALAWSLGHLVAVPAAGIAFHFCQKMFGGQASLSSCMRASAYLTGLEIMLVASIVMPVVLAVLVILACSAMWFWGWLLLGRGRARLSQAGAITTTVLTLVVSSVAGLIAMGVGALLYQTLTGESVE